MPLISYFYGIKIYMQYDDHNPPHFHVVYNEFKALVEIKSGEIKGELPNRVKLMIKEWLKAHKEELLENWSLALDHKILHSIDPLN